MRPCKYLLTTNGDNFYSAHMMELTREARESGHKLIAFGAACFVLSDAVSHLTFLLFKAMLAEADSTWWYRCLVLCMFLLLLDATTEACLFTGARAI